MSELGRNPVTTLVKEVEVPVQEPPETTPWWLILLVAVLVSGMGLMLGAVVWDTGRYDGRAELRQEQREAASNWSYREGFAYVWNRAYAETYVPFATTVSRSAGANTVTGPVFGTTGRDTYLSFDTQHGHLVIDGEEIDLRQLRHDYSADRLYKKFLDEEKRKRHHGRHRR